LGRKTREKNKLERGSTGAPTGVQRAEGATTNKGLSIEDKKS